MFTRQHVCLFFLALTLVTFSGCAQLYNIEPNYDEKNKTVAIIDTRFNDVEVKQEKIVGNNLRGNALEKIKDYKIYNHNLCRDIFYISTNAGNNTFLKESYAEIILEKYNKGTCYVTEVSNVRFFACRNTVMGRYYHYIVTETKNQYGYQMIEKLDLGIGCYEKIKDNTLKQAKNSKYPIKNYVVKKGIKIDLEDEIPNLINDQTIVNVPGSENMITETTIALPVFDKKIIKYEGILVPSSENDNCISKSTITVSVDSRNNLKGKLRYIANNGKEIEVDVVGTIASVDSGKLKFETYTYFEDRIQGIFKNNRCRGQFQLNLVK